MPVYEAIIVLRAIHPKETVALMKNVLAKVFEQHPTVRIREIQNLGDRVMGKDVNAGKTKNYLGRYIQMIYDGHPSVAQTINAGLKDENQGYMRFYVHRVKDFDYINHMYMKAMRHTSPFGIDDSERNLSFVRDFHRLEKSIKP